MLTPPGRGAIATIGVRGAGALAAVAKCFHPASGRPLERVPPGHVVFGRYQFLSEAAEEVVVGVVSGEELEVHCHGGVAAAEAILTALLAAGCRAESWREHVPAEARDPIAAAALHALADARTERTAAILLEQYHGALRRELEQIGSLMRNDSRGALDRLQSLLHRSDLGRHLTRPWRVVLTGAPNVGKSSLINALLGYQRAIVASQPGTTRDVLTATTAIDGWPVELADTAGLRTGGDAIEAEGVSRALRQIAEADLVVEVLDVTAGGQASSVRESPSTSRPVLIVHNKCDLALPPNDGRPTGLNISAKTGLGIDSLIQAIARRLVPSPPPRSSAVPFSDGHFSALERACQHLATNSPTSAQREIETLVAPSPVVTPASPALSPPGPRRA